MTTATLMPRLLNPTTYDAAAFDPATQKLLRATIDWFEAKGAARIAEEIRSDEWYGDFIEFLAGERAFAILLTPERDGGGDPEQRGEQQGQRHQLAGLPVRVGRGGDDPARIVNGVVDGEHLALPVTARVHGGPPRAARRPAGRVENVDHGALVAVLASQ